MILCGDGGLWAFLRYRLLPTGRFNDAHLEAAVEEVQILAERRVAAVRLLVVLVVGALLHRHLHRATPAQEAPAFQAARRSRRSREQDHQHGRRRDERRHLSSVSQI